MFSSCDLDISDISGWTPAKGYLVSASCAAPAWESVPSYSGFCRKYFNNNNF